MSIDRNLLSEIHLNKEHRLKILNLNNKILESKLDYLSALKRHYEDYWLDFDLKCYEAKMDCLVSKAKLTVNQAIQDRKGDMLRRLNEETVLLDEQISEAKAKLDQYKNLDARLMAEYRSLKDDLECQDLLIEISEGNTTVTALTEGNKN